MKRCLILGVNGMLGSMVYDYLSSCQILMVDGTARHSEVRDGHAIYALDAECNQADQISQILKECPADYIINCIGVINSLCRDTDPVGVLRAVRINALFPHILAGVLRQERPSGRVIHITTDCVFSGLRGGYTETSIHDPVDFYGKSKSLGEVKDSQWLNVRCSIIGPDCKGKRGLLEWFLSHKPGCILDGYDHHIWNGVTTLQFAHFCEQLTRDNLFENIRAHNHTIHFVPNNTVTKYELLMLFCEIYEKNYAIRRVSSSSTKIDRTLASEFFVPQSMTMRESIKRLHQYSVNQNDLA